MSLCIIGSIRGSFGASEQKQADSLLRLLNIELRNRGLPAFSDGAPDECGLRSLPCCGAGALSFAALGRLASEANLPWTMYRFRTERWIALPFVFAGSFSIKFWRLFFCIPLYQEFFSLHAILAEIMALAGPLGIPLHDGLLSEETAAKMADCQPISESEPEGYLENERSLWFDLYLAATYCIEDSTPLVVV